MGSGLEGRTASTFESEAEVTIRTRSLRKCGDFDLKLESDEFPAFRASPVSSRRRAGGEERNATLAN
eukprot:1195722-Prorocentrum_minimum.AAC.6